MKDVKLWTEECKKDEEDHFYLRMTKHEKESASFEIFFCDKNGVAADGGNLLSIIDRGIMIAGYMSTKYPISKDFMGHASFIREIDFDIYKKAAKEDMLSNLIGKTLSQAISEDADQTVKH